MRYLLAVFVVLAMSGCVTRRDKVALVRAQKVLITVGSPLAVASAEEVRQVGLDVGADKVDGESIKMTPEAARENAQGIADERGARQAIVTAGGSLFKDVLGTLPYGGAAAGLAGALWALWRKGQVQTIASGLSVVLEACKKGSYKSGDTAATLDSMGADLKLAEAIRQSAKG